MKRASATFVLFLALAASAAAHELHNAVLRLEESPRGVVRATLKTPLARDGGATAIVPHFGAGCAPAGEMRTERAAGAVLRSWRIACEPGLAGAVIRFEGLDPRTPDAIVTARFFDGSATTAAVDRNEPELRLEPAPRSAPAPAALSFLPLGIEHIWSGADHLLFVLGLLLAVHVGGRGLRALAAAITAFTLAHSLTLALATLGIWGLPASIVEVLIALSIVLVALELAVADTRRGAPMSPSLTIRRPALVAFAFGLLHGFGFAGALAEIGLPAQARGWALLLFNAGVEIGQLAFVAAVLLGWAVLRRLPPLERRPLGIGAAATVLGGIASYWTIDRVLFWIAGLRGGA